MPTWRAPSSQPRLLPIIVVFATLGQFSSVAWISCRGSHLASRASQWQRQLVVGRDANGWDAGRRGAEQHALPPDAPQVDIGAGMSVEEYLRASGLDSEVMQAVKDNELQTTWSNPFTNFLIPQLFIFLFILWAIPQSDKLIYGKESKIDFGRWWGLLTGGIDPSSVPERATELGMGGDLDELRKIRADEDVLGSFLSAAASGGMGGAISVGRDEQDNLEAEAEADDADTVSAKSSTKVAPAAAKLG